MSTKQISIVAFMVIVIGAVVIWAGFKTSTESFNGPPSQNVNTDLRADMLDFDFGSLRIGGGKVSHSYTVKNESGQPVVLKKLYTSCMCTEATLSIGGRQYGPFGMPGHGSAGNFRAALGAGEEAVVEATFDPAAHGPAGLGEIKRSVIIEDEDGRSLVLNFRAAVTP